MTQSEKIQRINYLKSKIQELDYFITTISVTERGRSHVKMGLIKVTETVKSFSFFGVRNFGIGEHKSEIAIPNTLLPDIEEWAYNQMNSFKKELDSLIN